MSGEGLGRCGCRQSVEDEIGRANRCPAQAGICGGAWTSVPTSLAVFWGEDIQKRVGADAKKSGIYMSDYICTKAPPEPLLQALSDASDRLARRFRNLEDALGRHQSIPAADRRHRSAFQRRGAEHSGGIHFVGVGLAGVVWSAAISRNEKVVWHEREQLRCGGRVRRQSSRQSRDGWR